MQTLIVKSFLVTFIFEILKLIRLWDWEDNERNIKEKLFMRQILNKNF